MATETFTTEFKFNKNEISKILEAMENEREVKLVRVDSTRLSDKDEIKLLLKNIIN